MSALTRRRSFGLFAAGAAVAVGMAGIAAVTAPVSAAVAAPRAVAVSGHVYDARVLSTPRGTSVVIPSGLHLVVGARVSVAFSSGTTVTTVTNRAGAFTVKRPAGTTATTATVSVNASGFKTWRETGVPTALLHGNYPILTALLGAAAHSQAYPRDPTITGRAGPRSGSGSPGPSHASGVTPASSCSGYSSGKIPPSTITVDNVGTGTVQTYTFQYYVENVLPDEWISSWPDEALEAGAIAVKEYGWYWVNNWRGGELGSTCYDVQGGTYGNTGTEADCDDNYQCFIPGSATAVTDEAFESTWPSLATRSGSIFETSYIAGTDSCASQGGNEMYQNGTDTCANDGYNWYSIVSTFYSGVSFSVGAAICSFATSSTACINRNSGGYTSGTKVIGWHEDSDSNENFYAVPLTSWCNGGKVTETCPFTVGSDLNSRYDGDPIISLDTTNNQCVGADSSWSNAVLGGCVPDGGAFVESNANGEFLISVGVSDHWYGDTGDVNIPYWLAWDGDYGSQLTFIGDNALNSWVCDPSTNSVCGNI